MNVRDTEATLVRSTLDPRVWSPVLPWLDIGNITDHAAGLRTVQRWLRTDARVRVWLALDDGERIGFKRLTDDEIMVTAVSPGPSPAVLPEKAKDDD